MDLDGQAITLLDAADGNRAALRIEKGKPQFRGWTVLLAGDDAAEGVFRLHHDDIAGIDREHRLGIGPIDIMEVALRRDGELVALPELTFGKAALRHDRGHEPGVVDHRYILISSKHGMAAVPFGDALERLAGSHQSGFIEMAADELECDRTAAFRKAAGKSNGWT